MARILINKGTLQPACVLIQAAGGGDSSFLKKHFDARYWTLSLDSLVMAEVTPERAAQIRQLLEDG